MKKKTIIILSIILVMAICLIVGFILYKNIQEKKAQRYDEIKESVKTGVEWNIRAMRPGCTIAKEYKDTDEIGIHYNSSFLINNGYIKKSELLDLDGKSYCDVFVEINTHYENPLDIQNNCQVYYKIYLKCKNYEEKGYVNWS